MLEADAKSIPAHREGEPSMNTPDTPLKIDTAANDTTLVIRRAPPTRTPARTSLLAGPPRRWLRQVALLLILLAAVIVRFYDLNWDQSQYNHPDERHSNNVVSGVHMPDNLAQYFDSGTSPLNPYNLRESWVYGTLPLFTTRLTAEWLDKGCAPQKQAFAGLVGRLMFGSKAVNCDAGFFTGYEYIRLVGRSISALADVITVLVVFLTGRRLFGWRVGLLAAFLSTFTVLQIQHSKFFVVESLLTLCTATCLYILRPHQHLSGPRPQRRRAAVAPMQSSPA